MHKPATGRRVSSGEISWPQDMFRKQSAFELNCCVFLEIIEEGCMLVLGSKVGKSRETITSE